MSELICLQAIDVWAQDYLMVQFNDYVYIDDSVKLAKNYTITPSDPLSAVPVQVLDVHFGNSLLNNQVFLVISPPTVGQKYSVAVSPLVRSVNGHPVGVAGGTSEFINRKTKLDTLIETRPKWWDTRPSALVRKILNVIGRRDDLIGGSRHDRIEPVLVNPVNTVTFVGTDINPTFTANQININVNNSANVADLMLAIISVDATASGDPTGTIIPPAGWNLVSRISSSIVGVGTDATTAAIYSRIRQPNDPTLFSWITPGYSEALLSGCILVYRGVNILIPIDKLASQVTQNSATTTSPSVTPSLDITKLLVLGITTSDSYASISANDVIQRIALNTHLFSIYAYDKAIGASASLAAHTLTSTSSQLGANIGISLVLRR